MDAIGHDKRGNTVFRRNEDGEDILVPQADDETVAILERGARGSASVRPLPKQKMLDDDTPFIADEFSKWKEKVVLGW